MPPSKKETEIPARVSTDGIEGYRVGTKRQILHDSTFVRNLIEADSQKQRVERGLPRLGGEVKGGMFHGYKVSVAADRVNSRSLLPKTVPRVNNSVLYIPVCQEGRPSR